MKPMTKSKLFKWTVGAGCTLTAGLILNQIQADDAFAIAHNSALAEGAVQSKASTPTQSQDPVQQEYQQYRSGAQGSNGGRTRRMGRHGQDLSGSGQSGSTDTQNNGSMSQSSPQATSPQSSSQSKPSTRTRQS